MTAQRMTYLNIGLVIGVGIWLTGFDRVSWFLYVPFGFMLFAGITGICPAYLFWKKRGLK